MLEIHDQLPFQNVISYPHSKVFFQDLFDSKNPVKAHSYGGFLVPTQISNSIDLIVVRKTQDISQNVICKSIDIAGLSQQNSFNQVKRVQKRS